MHDVSPLSLLIEAHAKLVRATEAMAVAHSDLVRAVGAGEVETVPSARVPVSGVAPAKRRPSPVAIVPADAVPLEVPGDLVRSPAVGDRDTTPPVPLVDHAATQGPLHAPHSVPVVGLPADPAADGLLPPPPASPEPAEPAAPVAAAPVKRGPGRPRKNPLPVAAAPAPAAAAAAPAAPQPVVHAQGGPLPLPSTPAPRIAPPAQEAAHAVAAAPVAPVAAAAPAPEGVPQVTALVTALQDCMNAFGPKEGPPKAREILIGLGYANVVMVPPADRARVIAALNSAAASVRHG